MSIATTEPAAPSTPAPRIDPVDVVREGRDFVLTTALWLPRSREDVFPFFADAHNLERITPPLLRFQVLTPKPIDMETGALIDYKLRVRGVPMKWRTRIAAWEPSHRFVDEQIRGPYLKWWHEHTFEDQDGGVLCRDRVEYRVLGGGLVNALIVQRDVASIFRYRQRVMAEIFGA